MAQYKKRSDGRYEAKVNTGKYDSKGRPIRITIYAKTTAELRNKVAEVKTDVNRGTYANDSGLTFGRYAESWLRQKEIDTAQSTYKKYVFTVWTLLEPLSPLRLRDVTRQDIVDTINKHAGHPDNQRMIRLVSKSILDYAIDNGLLYRNVAAKIRLKIHRPEERRPLTELEISAMKTAPFTPMEKAFVQILYSTGVRRGEALGLMKSDFDFFNGRVHIQRSVDQSGPVPVLKTTKSAAGDRYIPLPEGVLSDLREYLRTLSGLYLFPAPKGALMGSSAFKKFWDGIYRKISEETQGVIEFEKIRLTPHLFRHNYCSELYHRGIDVKTAQVLMGHSSVAVTLGIYTHLADSDNTDVLDKLKDMVI